MGRKIRRKSATAERKHTQTVTELSKRKYRQTSETDFKKQGQRSEIIAPSYYSKLYYGRAKYSCYTDKGTHRTGSMV